MLHMAMRSGRLGHGRKHPVCDALSNSEVAVELADLHEIDERRREVDLMFAIGPPMRQR